MIRVALEIEGEKDVTKIPLKVIYDRACLRTGRRMRPFGLRRCHLALRRKKRPVARFQGIEGDELDKEMKRIEEDEQKIADAAMASMNAVGDAPPEQV